MTVHSRLVPTTLIANSIAKKTWKARVVATMLILFGPRDNSDSPSVDTLTPTLDLVSQS